MRIIWDAGEPLTSREIQSRIPNMEWKYTTLVTLLGKLVDKDVIDSVKIKRKHEHLYTPIISEWDYMKIIAKDTLKSTYGGSLRNALCALFDRQLTDEQYERLISIIEE